MVHKRCFIIQNIGGEFENDVELYGTQTKSAKQHPVYEFENDVELYGTQTVGVRSKLQEKFENDVELYGTQTIL